MHDDNLLDETIPDELRQAIDCVRREAVPENARSRARDRAILLESRPADRARRRTIKLAVGLAGLAASVLLIGLGIWMLQGNGRYATVYKYVEYRTADSDEAVLADEIVRAPVKKRPADFIEAEQAAAQQAGQRDALRVGILPPAKEAGGKPNGGEGQPQTESEPHNTNDFGHIVPNPFLPARTNPLSTFSVDVDTASYSLMRQFLRDQRQLPPKDAVRIEELINYFTYDYPQPKGEHPVAIAPEVSACPWNAKHRLVRLGIQARHIPTEQLPPRNLVFLIDVSGSMDEPNRLPLVKQSFQMLVEQLTAQDRVAIVVYAGESGLCLPATPGDRKDTILAAVQGLHAGGSTNGASGIELAYKVARESFIKGGVNRVILATDGDFNVGVTSQGDLIRLVEEQRDKGVFLTALGYGMGNYKDSTIMKLADHGHGHYAYIDSPAEARKVFVEEGAALVTLAQDVKIQVEFNPKTVAAYRLLGYEKRLMRAEDFNNDQKHAGVLGSGHRVTALYEIVPAGNVGPLPEPEPLKYQQAAPLSPAAEDGELLTIKLRYKQPMGKTSKLLSVAVKDEHQSLARASADFRFAAAVASFGLLLRGDLEKEKWTFADVTQLAGGSLGLDGRGYRAEFVQLVKQADQLQQR